MLTTLGDVAPSKNVVKNCLAESKHGRNVVIIIIIIINEIYIAQVRKSQRN